MPGSPARPHRDERPSGLGWRLLAMGGIDIRVGETRIALALFVYCFLLGMFQFSSKTVRQSTFVDSLGFENLPYVYFLLAVCAYPLLRAYSRATLRYDFHRVVEMSTYLMASSVLLFWWLFSFPSPWIRFAFYIWISIVTVMMMSQFWSYANHALDPRQARRMFGFVLSGGLIGGVAGGQMASLLSASFETRSILLANTILLVSTLVASPVIRAHIRRRPTSEANKKTGFAGVPDSRGTFSIIRASPHLRSIAALMFLSIIVAQIIDLQFNWAIEASTDQLDQRTGLFGNLYSLMGLTAFVFQLLVTSRVHRRLGVGIATRVLPLGLTLGLLSLLVVAALFPAWLLFAAATMKIGESAIRYSLDQGTRELMFVPVSREIRARVKAYIDVLVQRLAKSAAALLLLTVTFGWLTPIQTSWIALLVLLIWLVQAAVANRHYIAAYRQGLLTRQIDPDDTLDLTDIATLEALIRSLGSTNATEVLHSLELLDSQGRGYLIPPVLLRHDDRDVRLATLRLLVAEGRTDASSMVQGLIADPDSEVRAEAVPSMALLAGMEEPEVMVPRLRDPDLRVRGAAVISLSQQKDEELNQKAREALDGMLSDAEPTTRMEAARILETLQDEQYDNALLQLLYDSHTEVVRAALRSVCSQSRSDGTNVLFAPVLISLLRQRRLKHDARQALVSSGERVIPLMAHFMNDPGEHEWVRRALPTTMAAIGSASAHKALVSSLDVDDLFLKHKIIQALASMRTANPSLHFDRDSMHGQIHQQSELYIRSLNRLQILSAAGDFDLQGIRIQWHRDGGPSLLQELLGDRMREHLQNLFRLMSLIYRPQEIMTSFEQLKGNDQAQRSHALEYLDNSLRPSVRRQVMTVLDDLPIAKRLEDARRLFELPRETKIDVLGQLASQPADDAVGLWIAAAAVETVRREGLTALYPVLDSAAADSSRPLIQETAAWAIAGLAAR